MRNYIRTHRKRIGLTQDDVAILLGCLNGTPVSRLERRSRKPNLRVAFACQVIFGIPAHELFPGIYQEVERLTIQRVDRLLKRIESRPVSAADQAKRHALMSVITMQRKDDVPPA